MEMIEPYMYPLAGGAIIGIAATIMLLFNGKITGISGILSNSLGKFQKTNDWRYSFILGLISGGILTKFSHPEFFEFNFTTSTTQTLVAGFLVGFGTLLGNGCTSGHGVCGLARLSKRSLLATCTFMGIAIITVYVRSLL